MPAFELLLMPGFDGWVGGADAKRIQCPHGFAALCHPIVHAVLREQPPARRVHEEDVRVPRRGIQHLFRICLAVSLIGARAGNREGYEVSHHRNAEESYSCGRLLQCEPCHAHQIGRDHLR